MNIFDMFKEFEKDDTKVFTNGYNLIRSGYDSYELIIDDGNGDEITVLMSNWTEVVK